MEVAPGVQNMVKAQPEWRRRSSGSRVGQSIHGTLALAHEQSSSLKYIYEPLEGIDTIRLLLLQPGSGTEALTGELRHIDIGHFIPLTTLVETRCLSFG